MTDAALLDAYARTRDQAAFAQLVRRHTDLVYSAARRQTGGDHHRAQEITQQVFLTVARQAAPLARHPVFIAWLHHHTRLAAANHRQSESRRRARETAAAADPALPFNSTSASAPAPSEPLADWSRVEPLLDDALATLAERDRQAVLLRYFTGQAYPDIGRQLGLAENTARMRTERALEKLRRALAKRGVTSTATALGLALTGHAVTAAPASVAASTLVTFASSTAVAATATHFTAAFFSTMTTTTKLTLGGSAIALFAAGLGTGVLTTRFEPKPVSSVAPAAQPPAIAKLADTQQQTLIKAHAAEIAALKKDLAAKDALLSEQALQLKKHAVAQKEPAAPAPPGRFQLWGADALQTVRAAEDALNEKLASTGLGSTTGWDQEMQRMELEIEFEHALASKLTSAQFNDYIRRKSVTARVLEKPLAAFAASDAEAETIFVTERDFGLRWGAYGGRPRDNPALLAQWQAARQAADNRLRESLGPARYEEWRTARNPQSP
jgi:RNA polymerase sigma factor (sigma-70 family)